MLVVTVPSIAPATKFLAGAMGCMPILAKEVSPVSPT
jgi:hypothetical protein